MKSIMITAPSSNTGKTTITLGILRALKNRGMDLAPFKTGPDYIDTKFLEIAGGNICGNLDMHMMGEEGIKKAIYMNKKEYGLIEGAMGYFDGIYNTYENSSYDIGQYLNIDSILVYEPKGEMFSAIPKIKGMVDFSHHRIKGIILNKSSKKIYEMLKEALEEYIGIKVLGYLPKNEKLEIKSRHLGLLQPYEIENFDAKVEYIAGEIEKTVDLDSLIALMKPSRELRANFEEKYPIKVGVAKDYAFNFYYSENIKILENLCHLTYFSPLNDKTMPDVDMIYIGGGYPELFLKELEENKSMRKSIKSFGEGGGYIFAEGAGLMYLSKEIDGYSMCDLIDGSVQMTDKTQKFGYTNMKFTKDSFLAKRGEVLYGKEFHKSKINSHLDPCIFVSKPQNPKTWECGYRYKNILAIYGHINFLGNWDIISRTLEGIYKESV